MQHSPQQDSAIALDDLFTIEQFVAAHPAFLSISLLRWQLRHRSENGLAYAVVPAGRRLLISRSRYEGWLATRVEQPRKAA